jgi:hypothetical protein
MNDRELQQLAEECRAGSEEAWEKLYNILRNSPVCLGFRNRLGDDWEDAVSETGLAFYNKLNLKEDAFEWKGTAAFWAYIKLLMQGAATRLQNRAHAPLAATLEDTTSAEGDRAAFILCQMRLLAKIQTALGPQQRAILEQDLLVQASHPITPHERSELSARGAGQETRQAVSNRNKGVKRLREIFHCGEDTADTDVCASIDHIWG